MAVVSHLAEGTGVRKTAQLTGVSRDTVGRILKRVGDHAKGVHDLLVGDLTVPEVQMDDVLNDSPCSGTINTAFVERYNGSSRHFNAMKQRKTYSFSKQYKEHEAMSWLMVTHYNFC
ncbi:MAG: helix-turn-helix domain-containing protein [Magnetococcales bacterium]|nr:helix-turn-helix domain-containing protein [Magnetococcales bacterium]